MINSNMRTYDYYTYGEQNAYGQSVLSEEVQGTVKMAINTTSQNIQENIKYKGATYMGLTHSNINDTYVIQYGNERLKVLYVNPNGRYKQVFMGEI